MNSHKFSATLEATAVPNGPATGAWKSFAFNGLELWQECWKGTNRLKLAESGQSGGFRPVSTEEAGSASGHAIAVHPVKCMDAFLLFWAEAPT